MSTPENIVKFNEIAGIILANLYEDFPVPITEHFINLFPDAEIISVHGRPVPSESPDIIFIASTVNWLITAGYINGDVDRNIYACDLVLSAKGLELLKSTPDTVNNSLSFGDKLKQAIKSGGRDVVVNVVSAALTAGVPLFWNK